ncbi:DUF927 domain-containing protein [Sporosarcina sp. P33]|uniref:DUF927 domain-containing protein n=1 Tax=Sporosarcina sp. P33 TaxID=1930764 RepID=UPI0009BD1BD5|nr:hypothetical protein SporoP33_11820 [Sporosarcina sp. P33]
MSNPQEATGTASHVFGLSEPIGAIAHPLEWQKERSHFNVEPNGELDKWLDMVRTHVLGYPPLEFLLAVGFSSVLVAYFKQCGRDQDSLFIGLTGKSTTGKTTGSKLALSIYGSPVKGRNSLFQSWNSTENALVHKLAGNRGVVYLMDEFSMSTAHDTTSLIYRVVEGRDRSRLNDKSGLQKSGEWATTVITNGENSILEKSNQNLGLMVRFLEFNETKWTKSAEHADALREVVEQHYGHAGLAYVQYLAQDWTIIDTTVKAWQEQLLNSLPESDVKQRVAEKYALILAALQLGGEALGIDFSLEEVEAFIIEHEKNFIAHRDNAERVYQAVIEDVRATNSQFIVDKLEPKGVTCKGIIFLPSPSRQEYMVHYLPSAFDQLLADLKLSNKRTVVDALKKKSYFEHESDRQTKRVKLREESKKEAVYAFRIPKRYLEEWIPYQ